MHFRRNPCFELMHGLDTIWRPLVTRGNLVTIVAVKHSGLDHKKSTNWTKISISTSKACCQCLASYRTDLIWSWCKSFYGTGQVVNIQCMFEAEVFDDVETEMHTLTQNKERCFEASKASFLYNGRYVCIFLYLSNVMMEVHLPGFWRLLQSPTSSCVSSLSRSQ